MERGLRHTGRRLVRIAGVLLPWAVGLFYDRASDDFLRDDLSPALSSQFGKDTAQSLVVQAVYARRR